MSNTPSLPAWTTYRRPPEPGRPVDAERFVELMRHPSYPRASAYDPVWVHANLMGPNVVWLTEALTQQVHLTPGGRVLDMGCGTALSSIFLARELGVRVWATDLWIGATENWRRIVEAGVGDLVCPIHAEAHALPFAEGFFDAAVSVDAYHYFGTDELYLPYYAAFVKPGGVIAMVVPGNSRDVDDFGTFRHPDWWRALWERSGAVEVLDAGHIAGGWDVWHRFLEASEAWSGRPVREQGDGQLLYGPGGDSLGFSYIIARRADRPA